MLTFCERYVLRLFGCHELEEGTVDLVHVAQIALQMGAELQMLRVDSREAARGGDRVSECGVGQRMAACEGCC